MEIKIGSTLQIYFNDGNINNAIVEVRAIVDNLQVVVKLPSGNYTMFPKDYLEYLLEGKYLTIL